LLGRLRMSYKLKKFTLGRYLLSVSVGEGAQIYRECPGHAPDGYGQLFEFQNPRQWFCDSAM
jgi:hypothetical protein